ncbi:MAG: HP1 family phage holin [Vibrio sp.]
MKKMLMEKTVNTSSYVASVGTAFGGLFTLSDVALLIGIITTVVLFVMQCVLNKKRLQQDAEYHKLRMKELKDHGTVMDIEQRPSK